VKSGGRIAYITCSVLPQENGEQICAFVSRHPEFEIVDATNVTAPLGERATAFRSAAMISGEGVLMTPQLTKTDGFFVSVLKRTH
jgi:16S rRNA (cytosine967-C5)-methyltransferase